MLELQPITLASKRVRLRPLTLSDCPDLVDVARDGRLWEIRTTTVPMPNDVESYVRQALLNQNKSQELPFTITLADGTIVGTTRYRDIDLDNDRLEIGSTWIAASYQKTFVNTHAKFLLLRHAFEDLLCIAVEFRADATNAMSRIALERLGAKQDGILRSHRKMSDGHIRDTAVYSIISSEWPEVKARFSQNIDLV